MKIYIVLTFNYDGSLRDTTTFTSGFANAIRHAQMQEQTGFHCRFYVLDIKDYDHPTISQVGEI